MAQVQSATSSQALLSAAQQTSTTKKTETEAAQDRFLKLLVTQMQKQDPLNPLDNAQVTSQFAQISSVTGIEKLNQSVQKLSDMLGTNQSLTTAAGMLGHTVLVPGNALQLEANGAGGAYELEASAELVRVSVRNAAGQTVFQKDLEAQAAGLHSFRWDGSKDGGASAPAGSYTLNIDARSGQKSIGATVYKIGDVQSASQTKNGVNLEISNGGSVSLADVRQIF